MTQKLTPQDRIDKIDELVGGYVRPMPFISKTSDDYRARHASLVLQLDNSTPEQRQRALTYLQDYALSKFNSNETKPFARSLLDAISQLLATSADTEDNRLGSELQEVLAEHPLAEEPEAVGAEGL